MTDATLITNQRRFAFGRNWRSYLEHAFDPEREAIAQASVRTLTGLDDLSGRTVIDIGCGSGIFSLAAFKMGARVLSFDADLLSVDCCTRLREAAGSPASWTVAQGSIVDPDFVGRLPVGDIVYSWGVLHHTGRMWAAVDAAASLVAPGGLLCVALYNQVERRVGGSRFWWHVKRTYVSLPRPGQRLMEWGYAGYKIAAMLITLRNPVAAARGYRQQRGMSLWHDWVDWLGGFPYEYASAGDVFARIHDILGLTLVRLQTTSTIGCNEFVFMKPTRSSSAS